MTMYLEHFGLREAPFRITPHTEFFFSGANRGATLEALLYAVTAGEGLVKVTGEVGSGKTMLCRVLMERLPQSVETIYLAVPSLSRDEMLAAVAGELGVDIAASAGTTRLLHALQDKLIEIHSRGRQVVALIDEAHAIPLATLEEIRLLSNLETDTDKLLQIVLFGQPELDEHLALPGMRQLKERITHSFSLVPLPPEDVREYIAFRLRAAGYHGPDLFGREALGIITEASEGLTRRINIFADKTLLAAFAGGTHSVTADHARAAVADTQIVLQRPRRRARLALVAAGGVAAGILIGFVAARFALAPDPASANAAPVPTVASTPAPVPTVASTPAPVPPAATAPAASAAIPVATVASAPAGNRVAAVVPLPEAQPRGKEDVVAAGLRSGLELLEGRRAGQFSVQLLVADATAREFLENYLVEASRLLGGPDKLSLVPAGSPEAPRLGVVYGGFRERAEAFAALAALPESLRQFRPYVRTLEALREEAKRARAP